MEIRRSAFLGPCQPEKLHKTIVYYATHGARMITGLGRIVTTSRRNNMEYAIGIVAAIAVGLFATVVGFDKDRSFYPVVLIVIAALYLLFATMAGSTNSLLAETIPALLFVAAAVLGYRRTPWLVVAGLALHGVFDFFHHAVIANPGVPV